MSRTSPSRRSSFSYIENPSRRSSLSSNPDVFSDDYALEPIDSRLDLTLQDSIQSENTLTLVDRARDTTHITPYPAIPHRLSGLNRPNSTSKRPATLDNASDVHDAAPSRTMSTSSRFSFIRSQSPYSGPTQPSHPYAMYPQITRASSVASGSTIRPHENPFIPTGGPEHPYAMYQQNTVPEDDDDDIGTQAIPLGFPRIGIGHQPPAGTSGSDVGDIVGRDGHIEQLPPYTRYADNIIAKGDMANISDASTLAASRRASLRSIARRSTAPSEHIELGDSSERGILLDEERTKESWRDKLKVKVCGDVTLWLLIFIVALIIFAGVIGGVIGGVVARKQSSESATATVFDDADPVSTHIDTPACPTGKYTIPFRQIQEVNSCVANVAYSKSWSCLDIAFLGITISDYYNEGNKTLQVRFDDYSVDTSTFQYGPQPPDFNGTAFDLHPYKDRYNEQLGVAMYFYQMFDKLIILPGWAIKPNMKREVDESEILERRGEFDGMSLQVNDSPWFCFWNSTINEFWIFVQQPVTPTSTWSVMSTATPAAVSTSGSSQQSGSAKTQSSSTSSQWTNVSNLPTPTITKREAYTTPYYPQYPQLVKMIEKRKPYGNVQPYCQRMVVMPDWNIIARPDNQMVFIKESQYAYTPAGSAAMRDVTTTDLQSNCICEWRST